MKKYENWSKVLIEPSSMNDARLFMLESRINAEEDIRVKEYDYMKDIIRKIVYTLEEDAGVDEDDDKSQTDKKQKRDDIEKAMLTTPIKEEQELSAGRQTFGAWDDNMK